MLEESDIIELGAVGIKRGYGICDLADSEYNRCLIAYFFSTTWHGASTNSIFNKD